jgi:hypothetical protein
VATAEVSLLKSKAKLMTKQMDDDMVDSDNDLITQLLICLEDKIGPEDRAEVEQICARAILAMEQATDRGNASLVKRWRDIRTAEREVRPIIGELPMELDSISEIYRLALDHAGIDTAGARPAAYRGLVKTIRIAMDASAAKRFADRYPNAGRLQRY